jgi:hypothetical protein
MHLQTQLRKVVLGTEGLKAEDGEWTLGSVLCPRQAVRSILCLPVACAGTAVRFVGTGMPDTLQQVTHRDEEGGSRC